MFYINLGLRYNILWELHGAAFFENCRVRLMGLHGKEMNSLELICMG